MASDRMNPLLFVTTRSPDLIHEEEKVENGSILRKIDGGQEVTRIDSSGGGVIPR